LEQQINLAVIGAGYWGRKVIQEYVRLAEVDSSFDLVQVCDLVDDNLSYCKNELRLGLDRLNSDYEAILKSPDIDAIHICTPNETHKKIGMQALNQGKHVLVEKPMATLGGCAKLQNQGVCVCKLGIFLGLIMLLRE
jgi:predicted dehydrogenase